MITTKDNMITNHKISMITNHKISMKSKANNDLFLCMYFKYSLSFIYLLNKFTY